MTQQEILKKVQWKDLRHLTTREMLVENNLTIPWFVLSTALAYAGYYVLALPFSAFFFLTGLRQVHNGFHHALGTNKFLTWFSLYSNSILMMVSIHAVKFNHIRHHKYCLSEMEHHLFPAVPTIKLPELARRIDAAIPEIEKKETF